jgi:protein tyrosine/serine phosphatase
MRKSLAHFFLSIAFAFAPPLAVQAPTTAAAEVASSFGEKLKLPGLPNAGKINGSLFRGAQPRSEGFQEFKKLGITTIVDLRGEDLDKIDWERKQAESLAIRFVHIPVSGWSPPTDAQVEQFLSLFQHNPKAKIFVHCRFGDDRTGVFVATYRMAFDHWSANQAQQEMYYFGFNGFWHPAMKSFVRDFPARLKTAPALVPFAKKSPAAIQ